MSPITISELTTMATTQASRVGALARGHGVGQGYSFEVSIPGVTASPFASVQGLGVTVEVIEYREGGERDPQRLPGRVQPATVTMRRAVQADDRSLWQWMSQTVQGQRQTREVSVQVFDRAGASVVTYTLHRAWPVKYTAPDLNATSNDVLMETVELAHESLEIT